MSITLTYNGIRVSTSNGAGPLGAGTTWGSDSPVSPAYDQPGSVEAAGMIGFAEPAILNHQPKMPGRFDRRASRWVGYAIAGLLLMMSSVSTQAQSREIRRDDLPRAEQRDTRPAANPSRQQNSGQQLAKPPQDFSQVHNQFHNNRQQIGAGPAVPRSVHIQQGHPLPRGYGKRLDERALRGMPRYEGYEWRRVGADIVLIAVATGVVYAILQGVLND